MNTGAKQGEPNHPDQLGPFVIESVLGRGAFGIVYRATDTRTQRSIAVKVLHRSDLSAFTIKRLQAEEEALRSLEDDSFPWFPRVVEAGRIDGVPYLAMEYVAGGRIDAYCDAQRLEAKSRVSLFRFACLAIQKAHQHGILHLDLKPAHILVQDDANPDGGPAPRIIDLGLARGVDRALVLDESSYGAPLGTPGFMSPEVLAGKQGDARSDVYALGIVLYWLLSGCKPKDTTDAASGATAPSHRPDELLPRPDLRWQAVTKQDPALAAQIAARRAESPASLHKLLRSDLGTIVMRAIEPEPKRRYQDPGELAADLQRYLEHRPIPGRRERLYRARLFVRRNRAAVAVLAGATAALVAVIGLLATNLAQAKANAELAAAEQRAVATSLFRSGQMAAQRGRWRDALAFYAESEQSGYADALELGIRRVEAFEASLETSRAKSLLEMLLARPDADRRRATLLLLLADLGIPRFDAPTAGLEHARAALALADANADQLSPVEREYAQSLLTETPREALECLRRARAHDASNHRVNLSYAMALLLLGEREAAVRLAGLFQALNPDDEEANYLAVAMSALSQQRELIDHAIATVHSKFGPEAGDVAEHVAATMDLLGWFNDLLRNQATGGETGVLHTAKTIAKLWSRLSPLQRAIRERSEQRSARGNDSPLIKVPPSIARCFVPLLQAAAEKPFRPQAIGAALASLQVGQVDAVLLFIHSMGLAYDGDPRAALARHAEALATPSIWCERTTLLLYGCLLGAATFAECPAEDSAARTAVRATVLPWFAEAGHREDWMPREMVALYETAMLLQAPHIALPMGHKWFALAPTLYRLRIAHAEVLALEGAVDRADTLLAELEADQHEADDGAKVRLALVRSTIRRLKKR